jgi:hypothetical protein
VDGTLSPSPRSRSQTEVVIREDVIDQNGLFMLESLDLGAQAKQIVEFAPVDGKPSYNGER